MFVKNPNKINKDLVFPCKSNKLKKFLVENKKIPFLARIYDESDQKYIWCFSRSEALKDALGEWANNKKDENFAVK